MTGCVFVSYTRSDLLVVEGLVTNLQAHGFTVWFDRKIEYGARWQAEIESRLELSGAVVVAMSPEARRSAWVQREVARSNELQKPVFPVLLAGEPWPQLDHLQHCAISIGYPALPTGFVTSIRRVLAGETGESVESLKPATDERLVTLLGGPVPSPNLWGRTVPIPGLITNSGLWTGVVGDAGFPHRTGNAPFVFEDCVLWHVNEFMEVDGAAWIAKIVDIDQVAPDSYQFSRDRRVAGSHDLGESARDVHGARSAQSEFG